MYNQNQYDDVMNKLDATRPVGSLRDPYVPDGNHELIVLSIEPFRNQEQAFCVRARLIAEKSNTLQPGAIVSQIWNLDKPAPRPTMTSDKDRFVDFVCKLQGVQHGQHGAACRALIKSRAEGGNLEAQPARGARISGTGIPRVTKTGPNAGKAYTLVEWNTVQQDGAKVAQTRQALDANPLYAVKVEVQQAPAPQGYGQQAPAPQGYGQPAPQPQYQQPAPAAATPWGAQPAAAPAAAPAPWGAPAPGPGTPQGGTGGLPF